MSKMNFTMFIIGAGVGSVATWFYAKKKYEQIAQEEIDSVKEVYSKRYENLDKENVNTDEKYEPTTEEIEAYNEKLRECGYVGDSVTPNGNNVNNTENNDKSDRPYIIPIDEFGETEDYDEVSLYYYADGILADADDDVIDDVNAIVGSESLKYLDDSDEDCVYVRNDRLKIDYEVVKDLRTYSEATKNTPHQRED